MNTSALLVLGLGLVTACSAGSGTGAGAPPAPGPVATQPTERAKSSERHAPPLPDVVRYGPSAMHYLVHRQLHIAQAYGGQQQMQDLGAQVYLRVIITGPADTGGYPITFTVDSVVPDSGMPQVVVDNMARVRALIFAGRLTSQGEFRGSAPLDTSVAQNVLQLVGNFRDFFTRIPAAGARVGGMWSDTLSAVQRAGGSEIMRRTVLQSAAPGWELRSGTRSLRIESTTTYTVTGSGQNNGQPFQLSGSGAQTARTFIAEDGRFLGGDSRDSTALSISLPVQQLAIPVSQLLRSTIAILP